LLAKSLPAGVFIEILGIRPVRFSPHEAGNRPDASFAPPDFPTLQRDVLQRDVLRDLNKLDDA
jgi:hypothetical protein